MIAIEQSVRTIPTKHRLYLGDARKGLNLARESVHLVLTSPPYWTLKEYRTPMHSLAILKITNNFYENSTRSGNSASKRSFPEGD